MSLVKTTPEILTFLEMVELIFHLIYCHPLVAFYNFIYRNFNLLSKIKTLLNITLDTDIFLLKNCPAPDLLISCGLSCMSSSSFIHQRSSQNTHLENTLTLP